MQDLTVPTAVTIQPTGRTASGNVRVRLICVTLGLDVRLPINQVIQSTFTPLSILKLLDDYKKSPLSLAIYTAYRALVIKDTPLN